MDIDVLWHAVIKAKLAPSCLVNYTEQCKRLQKSKTALLQNCGFRYMHLSQYHVTMGVTGPNHVAQHYIIHYVLTCIFCSVSEKAKYAIY